MTIKVILCDDHALIRRGIRDTLADAPDIQVVGEAGDYGELRALMRGHGCDVLVLDINLPGRSGLDVMRQLRDRYAGRAIALTGYGMESDVAASREAGFSRHLIKPVDLAALEAAIRDVTSSSDASLLE